jgi:hypothetical protein
MATTRSISPNITSKFKVIQHSLQKGISVNRQTASHKHHHIRKKKKNGINCHKKNQQKG